MSFVALTTDKRTSKLYIANYYMKSQPTNVCFFPTDITNYSVALLLNRITTE